MLRSKAMRWAAVLAGLLLAACVQPTPTPAGTQATQALGVPPTGYPGPTPFPTATLPAGYPAQPQATPVSSGYPVGVQQVRPTVEPTTGSTVTALAATARPSETAAPTEAAAATATTGPTVIVYRDFEIRPATTTIKAGTEVTFFIENGVHQPYAGAAAPFIFESPPNLGQGSQWAFTFNQPGTLTILCGYHSGMTATLIVEP
jgi:plastocyanin